MWPFNKRSSARRVPEQRKRESEIAKEAAEFGLQESLRDRAEVWRVSRVAHEQLTKNHISKRISSLLREGQ